MGDYVEGCVLFTRSWLQSSTRKGNGYQPTALLIVYDTVHVSHLDNAVARSTTSDSSKYSQSSLPGHLHASPLFSKTPTASARTVVVLNPITNYPASVLPLLVLLFHSTLVNSRKDRIHAQGSVMRGLSQNIWQCRVSRAALQRVRCDVGGASAGFCF